MIPLQSIVIAIVGYNYVNVNTPLRFEWMLQNFHWWPHAHLQYTNLMTAHSMKSCSTITSISCCYRVTNQESPFLVNATSVYYRLLRKCKMHTSDWLITYYLQSPWTSSDYLTLPPPTVEAHDTATDHQHFLVCV